MTDPLSVEEVREHFDLFEPTLRRLHEQFEGEHPDEIKRQLLNRIATIHLVGEDGYLIAQWEPDEMFILAAAAWNRHVTGASFGAIISATVHYAEQFPIQRVGFASPRPAWKRIARRHGFTETPNGFVRTL